MANSTDAALDSYPGARAARDHLVFDDPQIMADGARLIDPEVGGMRGAIAVHLDGATWALPKGVHIAPGRGVLFVLGTAGRLHVLVARRGRMRELTVSVGFAAALRREYFDRS